MRRSPAAVSRLAWGTVALNVAVILWGSVVRATGSGAGCGAHWPRCNGEVVPQSPSTETLIEFVHRASSGLAVLAVLALAVVVFASFGRGHAARRTAATAVVLIVIEAAIGAALVLFGWVGDDTSVARVASIALHLANTLLLLGALTLTALHAGGMPALERAHPARRRALWLAAGLIVVSALGAVTALGDTLFPSQNVVSGLASDFDPTAEVLIRLRVIHPVLAVVVALALLRVAVSWRRPGTRLGELLMLLVVTQLVAGLANVALLAPVPLQLVHLALADAIWIAFVAFTASVLSTTAARSRVFV